MADSDEYFDDSFELDEAALASIQATEERFGVQIRTAPQPPPRDPQLRPNPPPKRQKTTHGWVDPTINHRRAPVSAQRVLRRVESLDDNPEISVGADGSYVLNPDTPSQPQSNYRRPPPSRDLVRRALTHSVQGARNSFGHTASQKRARVIEQALAEASVEVESLPTPALLSSATQASHHHEPAPALESGSLNLPAELATLRARLAEMNATNTAMQQSLREAQEAQFANLGEVSNLRRTMDKMNQELVEAMEKAKVEREATEKVKAELQTKLKEETDRMATRLVFKQHEMETSTRKPTWGSARSRRVSNLPSARSVIAATPTRTHTLFPPPSTSRVKHHILRYKDQHPNQNEDDSWGLFSSPTSGHKPGRLSQAVRDPEFKGFHNAFVDSAPVLSRSPKNGRKGETKGADGGDLFLLPPIAAQAGDLNKGLERLTKRDSEMGSDGWEWDTADGPTSVGGEDMMNVDDEVQATGPMDTKDLLELEKEELMGEDGLDWGDELRRIVFTHITPQTDSLTLHTLLSTPLPPDSASKHKQAYASACQVILETCGLRYGHAHYPEDSQWETVVVDKVASAFVTISGLLSETKCILPLAGLLDLLMLLTLYVPAFLSSFLGHAVMNETLGCELDPDGPSQLLSVLGNIVRDHLTPPRPEPVGEAGIAEDKAKTRMTLAMAVVQLMESLCWNVKDGLVEQLGSIPCQPRVLETLLHPAQCPALIARTLRLLVLLATHGLMFRSLLSFPEADAVQDESVPLASKDWSRLPLIEKLCDYLVDPPAQEAHTVRHLIITFITLLSNAHPDALIILLDSVSLAPALVVCITKLSRLLWEDNMDLMDLPEAAKLSVETLYLSVNLLHHLVFATEVLANLSHKLIEATRLPGPFNGVTHMFMVTFGRLSWAEVPEWLDDDCKGLCGVITELAMEVIETVVAGPECDSLWAVWHQDEEMDDDEAEARMVQLD